ncbi:MAG: Vgb family protein [Thermomicrobiales bacterium]
MRWYISFHGGDEAGAWNNIHSFDPEGKPLGKVLATHSLPSGLALRELRGFAFGPGGDLYVANAWRNASQVLRFGGQREEDGRHPFRAIYVEQHRTNPGLAHPFDVAFGPDGHLYVPSQDTNVVGRYYGPEATPDQRGTPMPHPPALAHDAVALMPGTFVPSEKHHRSGVRTVRRAIFGPDGHLFVADRDADRVKRYDGQTGSLLREYRHHHLTTPVHLLWDAGRDRLLVGSRDRNAIFAIAPDDGNGSVTPFVEPGAGGLHGPAGMAFGPDGALYVCSREAKQVLRFDAQTGKPDATPFLDDLHDFPEFIAPIAD